MCILCLFVITIVVVVFFLWPVSHSSELDKAHTIEMKDYIFIKYRLYVH